MEQSKRESMSLPFLYVVTFLCQMIAGAVGMTVPIYANLLGASPFLVGLIGSAGGLIYSFVPLVSGTLCDVLGRKSFIAASLISYGFSCILYSLADEPHMLALIKVLEWFSVAAFWPAMEALLADSAPERLGETLRRFNISWGSAMTVGPVIGGVLISVWSVKAPFLFSAVALLSFGLLTPWIVAEPPRRREKGAHSPVGAGESMKRGGSVMPAVLSVFLFSSMVGIILSLFPSYATDLRIRPLEIGFITFVFGASRTITFYQAGKIGARLGELGTFLLGSLTFGFASFVTSKSSDTLMFALCFLIFGFGAGVSYAASISFIFGRWGSSRGYAAGVFESLIGLGYFLGPLIGGILSEYAPDAPYVYGLALSLAVFFIQLMLRSKVRPARPMHG